jgi:hypothetical protein
VCPSASMTYTLYIVTARTPTVNPEHFVPGRGGAQVTTSLATANRTAAGASCGLIQAASAQGRFVYFLTARFMVRAMRLTDSVWRLSFALISRIGAPSRTRRTKACFSASDHSFGFGFIDALDLPCRLAVAANAACDHCFAILAKAAYQWLKAIIAFTTSKITITQLRKTGGPSGMI